MIRLGIIGISEGNGHPYSWSAIFNGYDEKNMEDCGFPVIPQYLRQQSWPAAQIRGAQVTHVWTQDRALSEKIAKAACVENIVDRIEKMVDTVDAVLLARDDAENHVDFAKPFLEAGLPIYIDKPVALSVESFEQLYSLQQYRGQIFTCSAMRYSKELQMNEQDYQEIGNIREIHAVTPKSWSRYSVHIIEPVLQMVKLANVKKIVSQPARTMGGSVVIEFENGIFARLVAAGSEAVAPIAIRVIGNLGWRDLVFTDAFSAFKAALQDFIDGIKNNSCNSDPVFNRAVVECIQAGLERC